MNWRSDEGFGLHEVVVTTAIMAITVVVLFGILTRFFLSSTTVLKELETLAEARVTLETMARDVRAANPLAQLLVVSDYDTTLAFTVYCSSVGVDGCGSNKQRPVTYRVRNYSIEREVGSFGPHVILGPDASGAPVGQRAGAVVNPSTRPVFRYFDRNGDPIDTQVDPPPPSTFQDCVSSVQIELMVVPEAYRTSRPLILSTKVDLRNVNEVSGC